MRNSFSSRYGKGFTLIELLIVIAINGMLAACLLPGLRHAYQYGLSTACKNNMRQLGTAFHSYATDYRGWILPARAEALGSPTSPNQFWFQHIYAAEYVAPDAAYGEGKGLGRKQRSGVTMCPAANDDLDICYPTSDVYKSADKSTKIYAMTNFAVNHGLTGMGATGGNGILSAAHIKKHFHVLRFRDLVIGKKPDYNCWRKVGYTVTHDKIKKSVRDQILMMDGYMFHSSDFRATVSFQCEKDNAKPAARHEGCGNFLFADLHIESIPYTKIIIDEKGNEQKYFTGIGSALKPHGEGKLTK